MQKCPILGVQDALTDRLPLELVKYHVNSFVQPYFVLFSYRCGVPEMAWDSELMSAYFIQTEWGSKAYKLDNQPNSHMVASSRGRYFGFYEEPNIHIYQTLNGVCLLQQKAPLSMIDRIDLGLGFNDTRMPSWSENENLCLFDLAQKQIFLVDLRQHEGIRFSPMFFDQLGPGLSSRLSPDGRSMVRYNGRDLHFFDLRKPQKPVWTYETAVRKNLYCFDHDVVRDCVMNSQEALVSTSGNMVCVLDLRTGEEIQTIFSQSCPEFSRDGSHFVSRGVRYLHLFEHKPTGCRGFVPKWTENKIFPSYQYWCLDDGSIFVLTMHCADAMFKVSQNIRCCVEGKQHSELPLRINFNFDRADMCFL